MLRIISILWSCIFDLLLYVDGNSSKTIEEIKSEIDAAEERCRPYANDYEEEEA